MPPHEGRAHPCSSSFWSNFRPFPPWAFSFTEAQSEGQSIVLPSFWSLEVFSCLSVGGPGPVVQPPQTQAQLTPPFINNMFRFQCIWCIAYLFFLGVPV